MKAGFLLKKKGIWYLTPEGEAALKKYNDIELFSVSNKAYWTWKRQQPIEEDEPPEPGIGGTKATEIDIEQIEQLALKSIEDAINQKGPYEFQDLVAALLRGMGYYTPFVAPKGKDGGIDVIAYRDPLGTTSPRIKVQIKHRENSAGVKEIRELLGVLQKDGEVGIFVSTGGFASDAKTAASTSHIHVELIDLPRFINLWRDFYPKLTDDDKNLLPLSTVSFLSPSTT
jgi:restriction system protein